MNSSDINNADRRLAQMYGRTPEEQRDLRLADQAEEEIRKEKYNLVIKRGMQLVELINSGKVKLKKSFFTYNNKLCSRADPHAEKLHLVICEKGIYLTENLDEDLDDDVAAPHTIEEIYLNAEQLTQLIEAFEYIIVVANLKRV